MKLKRPPGPTEADVTRSIRSYLKMKRVFHWKEFQTLGSVKGIPDILGILKPSGRLLAIEVKRPGGKLRDHQMAFLREITENGGLAMVAYSVNDVIQVIEGNQIKGGI